jgi:hypothetical protein
MCHRCAWNLWDSPATPQRKHSRVRISPSASNRATIRWTCGHETHYWCPDIGGYVRDVTHQPGTLGSQVCQRLEGMGDTLTWPMRRPLVELIRYEYQAAYRAERAERRDG